MLISKSKKEENSNGDTYGCILKFRVVQRCKRSLGDGDTYGCIKKLKIK
jgi:hypothetical protein